MRILPANTPAKFDGGDASRFGVRAGGVARDTCFLQGKLEIRTLKAPARRRRILAWIRGFETLRWTCGSVAKTSGAVMARKFGVEP